MEVQANRAAAGIHSLVGLSMSGSLLPESRRKALSGPTSKHATIYQGIYSCVSRIGLKERKKGRYKAEWQGKEPTKLVCSFPPVHWPRLSPAWEACVSATPARPLQSTSRPSQKGSAVPALLLDN